MNKGQKILQEIQNLKNEIEDSKEKETIKFEQAIRNQTMELKQEIKVFIENQTNNLTSEFEDLAARVNQTDKVGLKFNLKAKRVKIVTKLLTPFRKHQIFISLMQYSH